MKEAHDGRAEELSPKMELLFLGLNFLYTGTGIAAMTAACFRS